MEKKIKLFQIYLLPFIQVVFAKILNSVLTMSTPSTASSLFLGFHKLPVLDRWFTLADINKHCFSLFQQTDIIVPQKTQPRSNIHACTTSIILISTEYYQQENHKNNIKKIAHFSITKYHKTMDSI